MRPTPIPDDEVWEGTRRIVMLPPDGDPDNEEIAPCEVLRGAVQFNDGSDHVFHAMRITFTDEDIEKLKEGKPVWFGMFLPIMVPFFVNFVEDLDPQHEPDESEGNDDPQL